jgi:hypothetical protein
MKRDVKKHSTIYSYLEPYLENGSEEAISIARKQYWREYKAAWRREKRKTDKEITTNWNKDELAEIGKVARQHKMSKTAYIKLAALSYARKKFLVPNYSEIRQIAQMLGMLYNINHRALTEDNSIPTETGKLILSKIFEWERLILPLLHNPKPANEENQNLKVCK